MDFNNIIRAFSRANVASTLVNTRKAHVIFLLNLNKLNNIYTISEGKQTKQEKRQQKITKTPELYSFLGFWQNLLHTLQED